MQQNSAIFRIFQFFWLFSQLQFWLNFSRRAQGFLSLPISLQYQPHKSYASKHSRLEAIHMMAFSLTVQANPIIHTVLWLLSLKTALAVLCLGLMSLQQWHEWSKCCLHITAFITETLLPPPACFEGCSFRLGSTSAMVLNEQAVALKAVGISQGTNFKWA